VTFAKMQAVSADVLLGNDSSGTTVQEITCTAAGRAILDDADAAAQRTTLGLVIGTNVQAWDADLDALAALSGTNTIYYRSGANTWSAVTIGSNLTFTGGTLAASGGGGGTPAGSDSEVQFNSTGSFGATSSFIVDTGGATTALVKATSPSNTKPALRLQSNGASQTAPVLAVTDSSIDVFRVMRDGTINDATWNGNAIQHPLAGLVGTFQTPASVVTSGFTASVRTWTPVDLSSATSDIPITAPATPGNGDWFGYYLSGRNQTWKATFNRNGNTVNGGTVTSTFTLQERGDHVVWRYLSGTWVPVNLRRTVLQFSPTSISGLQLWLDASDASTLFDATTGGSLVAADGAVARWEDKSGNNRHATQATSANRPVRKTTIQNGYDILRFDGSNDYIQTAGFSKPGALTCFVVLKANSWNGSTYRAFLNHGYVISAPSSGMAAAIAGSDLREWLQNDYLFLGNGADAGVAPRAIGPASAGTDYRVLAFNLSSTVSRGYVNGNTATSRVETTAAVNTASGQFGVGGSTASTEFWPGDIAEILYYDTVLSSTDRYNVTSYLMSKWGVT